MKKTVLLLLTIISFYGILNAQNTKTKQTDKGIDIGLGGIHMSGNWYISYRDKHEKVGSNASIHTNAFHLKRSYFTLKKDLNETFSVRYTQDITIDKEGSDAGNVETRLKYLYLKAKLKPDISWLTGTYVEVGMVHRPWLDYEQKINSYRVQGNMAVDRNKVLVSADFGVMLAGNIGAKMDSDFLKKYPHAKAMQGKYCSYAIGIYNGGGYAAIEKNKNKVIASRLSFRPFANKVPQLQVSGGLNIGKGNIAESPDFNQFIGMAAWTGRQLTFTAQYETGKGDSRGRYVDDSDNSKALKNSGYSFWGEYRIKNSNWAVWARYDSFTVKKNSDDDTERIIGGISYRVNKNIRLVLDAEHSKHGDKTEDIAELNLEIAF